MRQSSAERVMPARAGIHFAAINIWMPAQGAIKRDQLRWKIRDLDRLLPTDRQARITPWLIAHPHC
jgi:hypothetical protein